VGDSVPNFPVRFLACFSIRRATSLRQRARKTLSPEKGISESIEAFSLSNEILAVCGLECEIAMKVAISPTARGNCKSNAQRD
jgi:hypothetical protein